MFVLIGIVAAILVVCAVTIWRWPPSPAPHQGSGWSPFPPPPGNRSRSVPRRPVGRVPLMALVAAAAVCFLLFPELAQAAEVAPVVAVPTSTSTQVWFGNALSAVLMACVPPVAAIACAVLWRIAALVGVKATSEDQAKLNDEAKVALTQAIVAAGPLIAEKGWDHVDVKNQVVADALNFFLQRNPDRATKIATAAGVANPAAPSAAKDAAVTQSLMARLPDAASQAAASPATPPVDPPKPSPQAIIGPAQPLPALAKREFP